jgi:hypothetical protein
MARIERSSFVRIPKRGCIATLVRQANVKAEVEGDYPLDLNLNLSLDLYLPGQAKLKAELRSFPSTSTST